MDSVRNQFFLNLIILYVPFECTLNLKTKWLNNMCHVNASSHKVLYVSY